jgi:hypothetical protein
VAQGIIHVGWLNQNSVRAYPLSEEATRRDSTDSYTLPDNFLVDMVLPINAALNYNVSSFYLSKLTVFGVGVTAEFSYWTGSAASLVGRVTIDVDTFVSNKTYYLEGQDDFEGVVGKVVIGTLDTVFANAGAFDFALAGGRLESSIVVPDIRGVTGMRVLDASDIGQLFQGDIAFEPGANIRFTVSDFGGVTVLTISAIDGEGTIADCICQGTVEQEDPIRTINGVPPDALGNINLVGDDCLQVTPQANDNQVSLADKCSKPCCGCPELSTLVEDQKRVRDQVQTLVNTLSRLESSISTMDQIVTAQGACG